MPPERVSAAPVQPSTYVYGPTRRLPRPTPPALPSGWEREDDCEDGRHRYNTTVDSDRVYVSWWPEPAGHGSVVVVGPLYATAPLDALLAYLRALTPEQVTSQPARSGGAS